jgi:hypothetical protein
MEVSGQLHDPAALSPEKYPGTHWIESWVGSRAGLNSVEKRKSYTAENRTRAVQLVARRYTDWAIPTPT